ncbi:MAG: DUF5615 family PIN-like protein [Spirochaetes bacterium]|nr:DUF5615 family PIN-like protein [Spirochaetota bacterium]
MKFIADSTVSEKINEWLIKKKHDVITSRDDQNNMIEQALREDRIIISNDPTYGEKMTALKGDKPGIILIAIEMEKHRAIIEQIEELLQLDPPPLEKNYVVVVAPGMNRIMKL